MQSVNFAKLKKEFVHTTKYYSVGALGYIVEISIFTALITLGNMHYLIASPISTAFSVILTYGLHRTWTFKSKHNQVMRQFIIFALISSASIVMNTLLTALFVEWLGVAKVISKTLAIGLVSFWNFIMHRIITFKDVREQIPPL